MNLARLCFFEQYAKLHGQVSEEPAVWTRIPAVQKITNARSHIPKGSPRGNSQDFTV